MVVTDQLSTVRDRVYRVVEDFLGDPTITLTDSTQLSADLEQDEFDLMELFGNLEEEFGLEIPESEEDRVVTIGDIVTVLLRLTGETD